MRRELDRLRRSATATIINTATGSSAVPINNATGSSAVPINTTTGSNAVPINAPAPYNPVAVPSTPVGKRPSTPEESPGEAIETTNITTENPQ